MWAFTNKDCILTSQDKKSHVNPCVTQAKTYGNKGISKQQQKAVLLEWFNMTGKAKIKAVQDYLKDLLENEKKFLCFAHHHVRKVRRSNNYLYYLL
jgi:hypothetical protein